MLPAPIVKRNFFDDPSDYIRHEIGRFFGPVITDGENGGELVGSYPVDIRETDNELIVEAEMPGFEKNQVQVTLERGMLTITGERKAEEVKGEKHLTERRYHRVQRRFQLPTSVDEAQVDARMKNGVLTLKLQKKAEAKPKQIAIQ